MLRACVAVAVVVLVAVGPAAAGSLLTRYTPIVVLHGSERFAPEPVDGFVAAAELQQRAADGSWSAVAGPLPTSGGSSWRLDWRGCTPRDGLPSIDCYAAGAPGPPVVYGHVVPVHGGTVLEYWLFYRDDLWSPSAPQRPDFWQAHEGDWEAVAVVLDAKGLPVAAAYTRHCGGARKRWIDVGRSGTHPVVYVGLGSHANYFRPGATAVDPRCRPDTAVRIYKAYGVAMLDHASAGRSLAPTAVPVSATAPSWMRFPGSWGEDQYAGFPNNVFRFGTSPAGPASHALWQRPLASVDGWPLEGSRGP